RWPLSPGSVAAGGYRSEGGGRDAAHARGDEAAVLGQPHLDAAFLGTLVEAAVGAVVALVVGGLPQVGHAARLLLVGLLGVDAGPGEVAVEQAGREPLA